MVTFSLLVVYDQAQENLYTFCIYHPHYKQEALGRCMTFYLKHFSLCCEAFSCESVFRKFSDSFLCIMFPLVQIHTMLNLFDITSKFCAVIVLVIVDL
jgi:hypothetical protein